MPYEKFEDFKELAKDTNIKPIKKVLRTKEWKKYEKNIFLDIKNKIKSLGSSNNLNVLDIGCGCSRPVMDLISYCKSKKNNLYLLESQEMLDQIPDNDFVNKIPCQFPLCVDFIEKYSGKFDVIICYSVIHYAFEHQQYVNFIDQAVSLLDIGGILFIGDIPNASKHRRFVSSQKGKELHKKWNIPLKPQKDILENRIDDSIVIQILSKYRQNGYETYILPQSSNLSMSHVREDIMIERII